MRVAAGRVVAVGERHLADVARHRDRQLAAGVHGAGQHVARSRPARRRRAPRRAGSRAQCSAAHGSASGRPLTTTSTTGVPVATTASSSSCWRPRKPEARPVAELAGRRVVGQAGPLAEHDDRDVGVRGRRRRRPRAPRRSRPRSRSRARGRRPRRASDAAQRVEDRPPPDQLVAGLEDLAVADDAERVDAGAHLPQRLHVDEVAVVAEQVARAVGDRPDDRHAPQVRRERQHAVVLEQDQRALGEGPRGRATRPRPSDASAASAGDLDVRPLEQPEPELHPQHPADRRVEQRLVDAPVLEALGERRAERHGPRQLGVDAGGERQAAPPRRGPRSGGGPSRSSRRPCSPRR